MKVSTNYIWCAIMIACLMDVAYSEGPRTKIDQRFLDALASDESTKTKRPFCNAFTGCGKKRSFQDGPMESQGVESSGTIELPLSLYKALLRAASQNIRNTIDRDTNEYQFTKIPRIYLSGKVPLRKRFDVPSPSLDPSL